VDIVKHKHPLISTIETIDGIRMYSSIDICAMKINAILGRGKKKDFFDLAELLAYYKVEEIITFYEKKFSEQRLLISIPQAITYFEDADNSEDPVSLNNQTWEEVKTTIRKAVNDYLK
jgi:predicted nucleotidyltransferase component of viral defense system